MFGGFQTHFVGFQKNYEYFDNIIFVLSIDHCVSNIDWLGIPENWTFD